MVALLSCRLALWDLMISSPRVVKMQTANIPTPEAARASPILSPTPVIRLPNSFCRNTLAARNMVIVTEVKRKQLAGVDWGEAAMSFWSFRQTSRQMAKKGSRQPLNTCATRITFTRGTKVNLKGL